MRWVVFQPSELEPGRVFVRGEIVDQDSANYLADADSIVVPLADVEATPEYAEAWAAWQAGDDTTHAGDEAFAREVERVQSKHEQAIWAVRRGRGERPVGAGIRAAK